jgi:hypothetical protein
VMRVGDFHADCQNGCTHEGSISSKLKV